MVSNQLFLLILFNIGLAYVLAWLIFGSIRAFFEGYISDFIPSISHALRGEYEVYLSTSLKFWFFHILLFIAVLIEVFILKHA
jgi:hypothetical protein